MNVRKSAARLLAMALLGLPLLASAPTAKAADLDYGPPPDSYDRYGSAYDDPRYRDLYGEERHAPRFEPRYAERYDDRYAVPPPPTYYPRGSSKDGGYLAPLPHPPRFSQAPRYERHCAPRRLVKDRLRAEGWTDFHEPELRGDVARVKARRPSGRLFVLDVDRCTGEIVHARRVGRHVAENWPPPAYRYAPPPRRWSRAH